MSRRVGGVFLHAAHGPLAFAASCIAQNQILKGLEELEISGLRGGIERGAAEVARLAGVPVREVHALLPWDEIERTGARLRVSQPAALEAWKLHAGPFGFLDVITQLTIDGRAKDIQACVERVAGKVRADEALAEPLLALGRDVGDWQDLVMRCRDLLDDGDALASAWLRRRRRRMSTVAAALVVIVGALGVIGYTAAARGRVEAALAQADGCLVADLAPRDRALASNDEDARIAAAERRCEETRAETRRKQAQAEAEARAIAEAERERAARVASCEALAEAVRARRPTDPSLDRAGSDRAFAVRLASRALAVADLGPADASLPCWRDDALPPSVDVAIDAAFAEGVLALAPTWVQTVDPSPLLLRTVEARKRDLPVHVLTAIAERAGREADAALLAGKPEELGRASRMCALATRVGMSGGASCAGVASLVARR